jgi:uncharacterized protein (DUF58 family)
MGANRWFKWIAAAGFAVVLGIMAAPGAQALTVHAFVVSQSCVSGGDVAVKLSATVRPNVPVTYRWDFTNNGSLDTVASRNPTVTHVYNDQMRFTARVVARTATGLRASNTVTFTTKCCVGCGPGG